MKGAFRPNGILVKFLISATRVDVAALGDGLQKDGVRAQLPKVLGKRRKKWRASL
jgi:hypothetical protein